MRSTTYLHLWLCFELVCYTSLYWNIFDLVGDLTLCSFTRSVLPNCDAVSFSAPHQAQLIQMVVWMLQRRLLIQLHTYVCLLVPPSEDEPGFRDEDPPLAARVGGRSLSTPCALSFGSPSMSSLSSLLCPGVAGYWLMYDHLFAPSV